LKRRPALALCVALAALSASVNAAQSAPRPTKWQQYERRLYKSSAPADRYFGPLKLSYLGINNALRLETILAGDHTTDPGIVTMMDRIDVSLREWADAYSSDPQLARTYFLAVMAYSKIWTQPDQERAWQYMHLLVQRFPTSYFGKQVRRDLAIGFTEYYYAQPLFCPTPSPAPSPSPTPTPTPRRGHRAAPSPSPSPTQTPTAEPTDAPTPLPTAAPAPGGPNVEILTPPCVPAPSPTPDVSSTPAPLSSADAATPGSPH